MAFLKTITLPSGSLYHIYDIDAHNKIASLEEAISSVMKWIGITTTQLTDGSSTNPITIDGKAVTATSGNVCAYGEAEFIYNGSVWQLFGEKGSFGALAFKNSASTTYTPAGTVTQPTFNGTSFTSEGSYTPEGSVSTPEVTVALNTTNVNSITDVGTLPNLTFTVENENLTIGWSAGTLPTKGADTSVATSVQSATASQPTFSGTETSIRVSGTATGTVSKPTFSGTQATITVS